MKHSSVAARWFPKWPKTIAAWKAFSAPYTQVLRTSPRFLQQFDGFFDGMREAGMPEQ